MFWWYMKELYENTVEQSVSIRYFTICCMEVKWSESLLVVSDFLRPYGLYSPLNSPGQNTGVGSLSFLQGIFPTQRPSPGLLHCRQILYQLRHKGRPRIQEKVTYPFSSGSSRPRNWTRVSCIAGGFFTKWAIREVNVNYFLFEKKSKNSLFWSSQNARLVSWCLKSFYRMHFKNIVSYIVCWSRGTNWQDV